MGQSLMTEVYSGGGADPLCTKLMSQVLDVVLEQLGLLRGNLKSSGTKGCQDLSEDPKMAPCIRGVNRGVIQVTQDFQGGKVAKGLHDEPGVSDRCIGQPKQHLDELILAERGGKGGIL